MPTVRQCRAIRKMDDDNSDDDAQRWDLWDTLS